MKTILLTVSLVVGVSMVLGLPAVTDKNARAVRFDDEFHDEAEALIQNFNDLSERLQAVKNELKDGLEANKMEEQFDLNEFDDYYGNNENNAISSQAGPIMHSNNKHFKSNMKDKLMTLLHRRPAYINEEEEPTTEEPELKCNETQWKHWEINYADLDSRDKEERDGVELAIRAIKKEYPEEEYLQMTTPDSYIESDDNTWHCFLYKLEAGMVEYVVTHQIPEEEEPEARQMGDSVEFELDKKIGDDGICNCLDLVVAVRGENPNVAKLTVDKESTRPAVESSMNENYEQVKGNYYANRQSGRPVTVDHEEEAMGGNGYRYNARNQWKPMRNNYHDALEQATEHNTRNQQWNRNNYGTSQEIGRVSGRGGHRTNAHNQWKYKIDADNDMVREQAAPGRNRWNPVDTVRPQYHEFEQAMAHQQNAKRRNGAEREWNNYYANNRRNHWRGRK